MTLSARLAAIDSQNIVSNLLQMTHDDQAMVHISSTGTRLVSVRGFEGSIEIDDLVQIFRRAEPLSCTMSTPSNKVRKIATVKERADCIAVCNKIKDLYQKCDALFAQSSYLFQAFSAVVQSVTYRDDMKSVLLRCSERLCEFSPDDFKVAFPGQRPAYTYNEKEYEDSFGNGRLYPVWRASEEMVVAKGAT